MQANAKHGDGTNTRAAPIMWWDKYNHNLPKIGLNLNAPLYLLKSKSTILSSSCSPL
jgi:hypothetical protein